MITSLNLMAMGSSYVERGKSLHVFLVLKKIKQI